MAIGLKEISKKQLKPSKSNNTDLKPSLRKKMVPWNSIFEETASLSDIPNSTLVKNEKLFKRENQLKIKRVGPKRPWQEGLAEYATNDKNLEVKLTNNWFDLLDFSPVSPIGPMQVNSSIRNLVQEKLQPEQVQDFLNRFKSWLFAQQKVQNPLGMFCDKLKEFATEGDSAILNAMTDEDRELGVKFLEENQKIELKFN